MSYRVPFGRVHIECDSIAEALALAARVDAQAVRPSQRPSADEPPKTASDEIRRQEHARRSLLFLGAVRDAGDNGASGTDLVKAVKTNGTAGLGTVRQQMERLLGELKFEFAEVAQQKRSGDTRSWAAGPRIGEAIKALKGIASK